ncbi:uncharacterized protein METZ01_LOCUS57294 [marine metagenome]|uniref:Uncharacterized protein n=1 Tax=marine metagenome TaxID=408172 RepID=A0A381SK66_9ZZZZ
MVYFDTRDFSHNSVGSWVNEVNIIAGRISLNDEWID